MRQYGGHRTRGFDVVIESSRHSDGRYAKISQEPHEDSRRPRRGRRSVTACFADMRSILLPIGTRKVYLASVECRPEQRPAHARRLSLFLFTSPFRRLPRSANRRPGSSIGVSAMNAARFNRRLFNKARNTFQPQPRRGRYARAGRAVDPRSAFGVVAMPHANVLEANRRIQVSKGRAHALRRSQCRIRRREYGTCRCMRPPAQCQRRRSSNSATCSNVPPRKIPLPQCSRSAQRARPAPRRAPPLRLRWPPPAKPCPRLDSAERPRMQHQVIRAQRRAALQLAAERGDRLPPKLLVPARQVDQVVRMRE